MKREEEKQGEGAWCEKSEEEKTGKKQVKTETVEREEKDSYAWRGVIVGKSEDEKEMKKKDRERERGKERQTKNCMLRVSKKRKNPTSSLFRRKENQESLLRVFCLLPHPKKSLVFRCTYTYHTLRVSPSQP